MDNIEISKKVHSNEKDISNILSNAKIVQWLLTGLGALVFAAGATAWTANSQMAVMSKQIEKLEAELDGHQSDPKLHHNIKEQVNSLVTQLQLNTQRLAELTEDLKSHEDHPKLHENILVEVEKLKQEIEFLKKIIEDLE